MDRCVNCGIATAGRCNTLRRRALDDKTTLSVIRQFLAPKPVEEASRICHNCWVAADRAAIHMSGPSSSSQGSFNKSDISGNTNQLGSVTTAVPKLQIQPPSKEPQLAAANTKLSVSDIEVQDQTKILVTKVYRYFEQESEELKKKSGDLDLTPLSNFRQRTALATGVSETTLQQILKEEEERNADKRQEPPQKRRAALKRRRQSDSEEPENSEIILPVEMKLEPSDGEISMNEEPEIFIPPVKVEPSDGDTDKEQTDPLSLDVKTESGDDGVDTSKKLPFTSSERELIVALVQDRPIIEDTRTHAQNIELKKKAWDKLTMAYNAQSYVTPRNNIQLKRCWEKIKSNRKKELSVESINMKCTGGGSPEGGTGLPSDNIVDSICPFINITVPGVIDSNSIENDLTQSEEDIKKVLDLEVVSDKPVYQRINTKIDTNYTSENCAEGIEVMNVDNNLIISEVDQNVSFKPQKRKEISTTSTGIKKICNETEARIKRCTMNMQQDSELHELRIQREKAIIQREENLIYFEKQLHGLQLEKMKMEIELLKKQLQN